MYGMRDYYVCHTQAQTHTIAQFFAAENKDLCNLHEAK